MILLPSRDPALRIEHTRSLLALSQLAWTVIWTGSAQAGAEKGRRVSCPQSSLDVGSRLLSRSSPRGLSPDCQHWVLGPIFQSRARGRRGYGPRWGDGESAGIPAWAWVEGRPEAPKVPAGHLEWTGLLSSSLGFSLGFPHSLQSLFFFLSFHFFLFLP